MGGGIKGVGRGILSKRGEETLKTGQGRSGRGLELRHMALFGLLGGLTFGLKLALAPVPNVEPVSLLVMLFAAVFGWRGLWPVWVYSLLELGLYGVHLWSVCYLYLWPLLFAAALLLRPCRGALRWALLSGCFGLLFGLLCVPVCLISGGPALALSWWLVGLPYDVLHGGANFVLTLVLFCPLRRTLERLYRRL